MDKTLRLTLVGVLTTLHLAGDLIWMQAWRVHNDWLIAGGFGLSIGQVTLIAAWGALAPGRLMVRLPWSLFMGVLMWYALVLGQSYRLTVDRGLVAASDLTRTEAVVLGLAILFGVLVNHVPLGIAKWGFGWRLVVKADEPSELGEHQFRLSHLLAGMFLLSVALSLGRVVLPAGRIEDLTFEGLWIVLAVVAICNLLVTSPCIWVAFVRWRRILLLAGIWVPYAVLLSWLEVNVLTATSGPAGDDIYFLMCVLNLTQCVTVWGTLLLLRAAGFRLVRKRKPTAAFAAASAKIERPGT